jgi:hypothetical protein
MTGHTDSTERCGNSRVKQDGRTHQTEVVTISGQQKVTDKKNALGNIPPAATPNTTHVFTDYDAVETFNRVVLKKQEPRTRVNQSLNRNGHGETVPRGRRERLYED